MILKMPYSLLCKQPTLDSRLQNTLTKSQASSNIKQEMFFTDESGNTVTEKKDKGDIYAVLYEAPSSDFSLTGNLFLNDDTVIDKHCSLSTYFRTRDDRNK